MTKEEIGQLTCCLDKGTLSALIIAHGLFCRSIVYGQVLLSPFLIADRFDFSATASVLFVAFTSRNDSIPLCRLPPRLSPNLPLPSQSENQISPLPQISSLVLLIEVLAHFHWFIVNGQLCYVGVYQIITSRLNILFMLNCGKL